MTASADFLFPQVYSFPPFFTLQPVLATRTSQLSSWSQLIQSYCRHHALFVLNLSDVVLPESAREVPAQKPHAQLFYNPTLRKRLSADDAREVVEYMASKEGGQRAEWKDGGGGGGGKGAERARGTEFWVYWRRPEEWATVMENWVESTGQKGVVLTVYELQNSDSTVNEEFHGMDEELMQKSLQISVKRGKAQVFGGDGQQGVKFF